MARFWVRRSRWVLTAAVLAAAAATAPAQPPSASPIPVVDPDAIGPGPVIRPVQAVHPTQLSTPTQSAALTPGTEARVPEATAGATAGVLPVAASTTTQAINASDAGDLLSKSTEAAGVEVQKRNSIVADPRIRGYRSGQYYTGADGGLFVPARADLDTPISKYDPGSIRDVILVRGPYTALYGPAFAVLDVATVDSPRARDGCGSEWHVRTLGGYQT